jgi:hypothetical protein
MGVCGESIEHLRRPKKHTIEKENANLRKNKKNNDKKNDSIARKANKAKNNDKKGKEYKNEEKESGTVKKVNKNNNNNYNNFNINVDYYITCPKCKKCLPYIKQINYDANKKDFIFDYICECGFSDKKNLYLLIDENEPENVCPKHIEKQLIYFCKNCEKIICEICKDKEHKSHDIVDNTIANEEIEKLQRILDEKKYEFTGYEIIKKILKKFCSEEKDDLPRENENNNPATYDEKMSDKSKKEKKSENNNEINDRQDNCLQEISSEKKTNENEKEVNEHPIKLRNQKKIYL